MVTYGAVELEEFNFPFPIGATVTEGEDWMMMLSMAVILVGVDITTWVAACWIAVAKTLDKALTLTLAILAVMLEVTKSLICSSSGYAGHAGHAGQTKRAMHRCSSIAIMYGCIILVAYISGTRDSPQTTCVYVIIC